MKNLNSKLNLKLILALAFPLIILFAIIGQREWQLVNAAEATFPISGFDPRDLLAGHYIEFAIDFGDEINAGCTEQNISEEIIYACLDTKTVTTTEPKGCSVWLAGECHSQWLRPGSTSSYRFKIEGIERFYVDETKALDLEKELQDKKGEVTLAVSEGGNVLIKRIKIGGYTWGGE